MEYTVRGDFIATPRHPMRDHSPVPEGDAAPPRVVVIVDDPSTAEALAAALAEGFDVVATATLREGLDEAARHNPHAVMLDLALPDAEGVDGIAAIVARHPATAIVVVTDGDADDADDTTVTAIALGAQDVVAPRDVPPRAIARAVRLAIERKRAEWSFVDADARHRSTLDAAPVGIWRGDRSGVTAYANERLRSRAGGQQTTAQTLADLLGAAERDRLEALFAHAAANGHAAATLITDPGPSVDISLTHVVDADPAHEFLAFVTDTSAGVPGDGAPMPHLDPAIATLLRTSRDALVVLDTTGTRILTWNAEAERLYGVPAAQALGRSMWEFIPADEHEATERRRIRALAGLPSHYEAVRQRGGDRVAIEVDITPVRDRDGAIRRIAVAARDITGVRAIEAAKRDTETLLRTLIEAAPVVVTMLDREGRYVHIDGRAVDTHPLDPQELIGRSVFELYADAPPEALEHIRRALAGEEVSSVQHYKGRAWDVRHTPFYDDGGALAGVVGIAVEVTDRLAAESRFTQIVQHVSDVISIHHPDGRLRWGSPAGSRLFGFPTGDAADGIDASVHIHPDDRHLVTAAFAEWRAGRDTAVEYRVIDVLGTTRYVESVGVDLTDHPSIGGIVVTTRDVTERREVQRELAHAALHDPLTNLPNRPLLVDGIRRALEDAAADGHRLAIALVDVDHFKLVNDALGHDVGDEVLRLAADNLREALNPDEIASRVSGDGFAICFPRVDSIEEAHANADRVISAITGVVTVAGQELSISASCGLVVTDGTVEPDQLIADAEVAMYAAKERGRGRVELFDDAARTDVVGRLALERELRDAVARNEFRLFFQPQVELRSGTVTSFEALIRWDHPTRGLLSPASFIDVAEQSRLVEPIGRWVLQEACRYAAEWRRRFPERRFTVAVNLSARQLADDSLPDLVSASIASAGVEPSTLCLEITESMLMEESERAVTILRRLKECGVQIALDDFGTGYSSLAYLKRFPLEQLKVDRSFVSGLGRDPEDFVIVSAIVNLARSLGVEVVAEGVENERHRSELDAIGCTLAQGYLWSPPVPASSIPAMLERGSIGTAIRPVAAADRVTDRSSQAIDVVSLLTHELRAPLTIIKGYAETMSAHLDDSAPPVVATATSAIARNVATLDNLIVTLSDVSALESGTLPLRRRPVDLGDLVRTIAAEHRNLFPDHEVRIATSGEHLEAYVDPERVRQVLVNLMSNAAKFSPAELGMDITIEELGPDVQVSVVDYGPGVPPELVGDIFRKFFRVDPGMKGTGLGLYIARSLARAHGGELSCRTASTGGAEFVLTIPRSKVTTGDLPAALDAGVGAATRAGKATELPVEVRDAVKAIDAAVAVEQVVGALISAVHALGGATMPARVADPSVLSHEISLGSGEPLLVAAPPGTASRVALDAAMPGLVEIATRAARRIDDALVDEGRVDATTGLTGRRLLARAVSRLKPGATIVLLRIGPECDADLLRALSRLVRDTVPAGVTAGRFGDDQIALLLAPDARARGLDVDQIVSTVEERWTTWQPKPAGLTVGSAVVGADGSQAALLAASGALG